MDNENSEEIVDNSNEVLEDNINKEEKNNDKSLIIENEKEIIKAKEENKNEKDINEIKNNETEYQIYTEKSSVINKKMIVIFSILLFIIILSFSIFICFNKINSKVYKNIYVLNNNVSGYSYDDLKKLFQELNNKELNKKISVIQDSEEIYSFIEGDIELKINENVSIDKVLSYGRKGNIFKQSVDILKALVKNKNIEVEYTYNKEKLDEILKNIDLSIKDRTEDTKYNIDEENKKLVITIGKTGNGIEIEKEENKIIELIKSEYYNNDTDNKIVLDIIKKYPEKLNEEEVYKNVKKEPQDAYIDRSNGGVKLVSEKIGFDLDIGKLKEKLNSQETEIEGNKIEIELKVIEPKVKFDDLGAELFRDKLSGYTTYFDPGQYARANNLKIALEAMNNKILMPGEVYSYNDTIGDTTYEKGYMAAATFKGGTTVNEVGGGICQTVSTLYNVVLMANLEIVERHQHGLPVGYVEPSRDATVYSPYLDFKFKNTRQNPIKIVTSYSNSGNLNVSIYGIKEKEEYDVEIFSQYIATIPFTTRYIYDENMPEGEQKIVSYGVNGYTSQSFIKKSLNGVQVSYDLLSKDTYNAQQQVVVQGTKHSE